MGDLLEATQDIGWTGTGALAAVAATVIALLSFATQVRGLRRALASQTYQYLVTQFNDFQRLLVERSALYQALYRNVPGVHVNFERTDLEVKWALGILFNWYENAAIQTDRYKVIPGHLARHWKAMLRHELKRL